MRYWALLLCSLIILCVQISSSTTDIAAQQNIEDEQTYDQRMNIYHRTEALTFVPWYYLAAIDQYERNIHRARQDLKEREGIIAIGFTPQKWTGILNPDPEDQSPNSIRWFGGIGMDGNGDGYADREDDEDIIYTMASYLQQYGPRPMDFRIALREYYQRSRTVEIIQQMANIYDHFGHVNMDHFCFPLDLNYNYSYSSSWGAGRGWGGRRIHEGTDLFADYGTPVRSTTYGRIEIMGWNKFGGWRVGIRDVRNNYHYYAHLSSFNKDLEENDFVEPGTVIGYVGSTGYGKPGTSGKFPPHLHYGIYKDNGRTEWSFDPYPYLRRWEKQERSRS